jgi:cytochrome c553
MSQTYESQPQPSQPHLSESAQHAAELEQIMQERKLLRRLQTMMNMCMQVIAQDASLSLDEASQMIADCREAALNMFPGKELAYDLIWKPRFQRLMMERFRLQ